MRLFYLLLLNLVLTIPTAKSAELIQDWVKVCENRGAFAGRCYVSRTLNLKKTGKKLFQIAAGYPLDGEYPLILVTAPLGIYLPPGVRMQVDGTETYRAVIAYCNIDGCHAYYRLTKRTLNLFQRGRWLNVSFVDGTRKEHLFQVSLNGFTTALQQVRN